MSNLLFCNWSLVVRTVVELRKQYFFFDYCPCRKPQNFSFKSIVKHGFGCDIYANLGFVRMSQLFRKTNRARMRVPTSTEIVCVPIAIPKDRVRVKRGKPYRRCTRRVIRFFAGASTLNEPGAEPAHHNEGGGDLKKYTP
jgi:hypothetical protein